MNLTARELATVLAALRYWQHELAPFPKECVYTEAMQQGAAREMMPEHFQEEAPLTGNEIDVLCELINC